MADMLEDGARWLEQQRTAHMARSVVYHRGSDSVELAATVGKTVREVGREFGVRDRWESRDYIVLASDLVLGGSPITPVPGDRVLEETASTRFVYEVLTPPGNEPCWRYSDNYRISLRIHTKLVGEESL